MRYQSKTLYSKPGLKREVALKALQTSPAFRQGSVIEDFKRQGDRWIAKVKVAEFPPPKDEEVEDKIEDAVEESDEDEDDDDSSDDSPVVPESKEDDDGDGDKGESKSKEDQIIDLLHKVLDAVGGGESDLDPLGDLEDGPVPPPPGDLGLEDKPAGGSKKERAKKEGPTGEEMIPTFSSLEDQFKAVAGKLPTVVVSRPDDGKSIKQAKEEVEAVGSKYGYKVAKAVREDGTLRVVASVR